MVDPLDALGEAPERGPAIRRQEPHERLTREVERAQSALASERKAVAAIEAKFEQKLTEGKDGEADTILPLLERRRRDEQRACARLTAATDPQASAPTEAPSDGMLDFYSALSKAVRGRLDETNSLSQVNDALSDLFDRFELTTTEAGVEVKPVLSQATAARIIDGLQEWPHGIEFAGRDVVRDEQTGVLISFGEPEEAARFEDASLNARPAPTLTAKEAPPLRAIEAPAQKFANSLECGI